ncbi:hypothetical protein BH10PSE11_BH10PSE11_40590 [soil metagenome]
MSKKFVRGLPKIDDLVHADGVAGNQFATRDVGAPTAVPSPMPALHQSYFTSYSANFEDVILNRIFANRPNGFYVDIGAAHPLFENDTKLFYDRGWTGINVEPNPIFFELLVAERPRDCNFSLAVSESAGDIDFYEVVGTGLSTCDPKQADIARKKGHRIVKRSVTTAPLSSILDQVTPPAIDFMKIDVEGFEQQVLSSNDWSRYRPSVILIEVTYPESPTRRPTTIRADLEKLGYHWRYFDGLNDFYVIAEFALGDDIFDRPPNVFDGFKLRATADLEQQLAYLSDARTQSEEYAQELAAALQTSQEYGKELERAIAEANQKHSEQTASLTAALEASRRYSTELEAAITVIKQAHIEQVDSLTAAYDSSRANAENLLQKLTALREDYSVLQLAENRVGIELANEKFDRHHLSVGAEAMRKELVTLQAELERWAVDREELLHLRELHTDEAALRARLAQDEAALRGLLVEAEAAREEMLKSTSWQLTRPYRRVGGALKALKRRMS